MSDETPPAKAPFIHILAGDQTWNVCLNFVVKWVAALNLRVVF